MEQEVCILGAGRSGIAAARLLASQGRGGVLVSETPPGEEALEEISSAGFAWSPQPQKADMVILSPGFSADHPWVEFYRKEGAELIPEFEWGSRVLQGKVLAVTGSLGKTSMVMLAAELLKAGGNSVTLSGNIGTPVCDIARTQPVADVHVMELSSFQLEASCAFRADAAVCLNLVPNHLDRHPGLGAYAQAKARLFAYQTSEDTAAWPDPYPVEVETEAVRRSFAGVTLPALEGTVWEQGALRENLRALFAVLEDLGLPEPDILEQALRGFTFPPHRMQRVQIPGAGLVIDDSKSTCLSATRGALEATPGHVHLIVGGRGKGESLSILEKSFADREVSLYLIGETTREMQHAWNGHVGVCEPAVTLERAIKGIWARREQGEPLLFSPGCASFDQFQSYTHRGDEFQRLVTLQAQSKPL